MLKKSSTLMLVCAIVLNLAAASLVRAQSEAVPVKPMTDMSLTISWPQTGEQMSHRVSPLTTTPTTPLWRAADPRYFTYGGETIALFGISGSYVPHVVRDRPRDYNQSGIINPVIENCTYDQVGALRKYQQCVAKLKQAGLNHLRIWVALNHSPGKLPKERGTGPNGGDPYPNEQPFQRSSGKWNLDLRDTTFFSNLYNVVKYCQDNGIIVGIVLFDPWSAWVGGVPANSPWYEANNIAAGYPNGIGFTDPKLFVMAENPTADPETGEIDYPGENADLRKHQVTHLHRTVNALTTLNNFYWELANEPDQDGRATGAAMINWHKYMARKLYEYEDGKGKHHLIAANVSTKDAIEALSQDSRIDIINSHYVKLKNGAGPIPETNRFSGIRLLQAYNVYRDNGTPGFYNTKRWGFNESQPSGAGDGLGDPVTADSARIEAWEFFMNGGALFDHLSYRWANPVAADNHPASDGARTYYSYLAKFMNTFSFEGMKRLTGNQTLKWATGTPVYGSPYWAAMGNGNVFLFYMHRSTISAHAYAKYEEYSGSTPITNSLTVQNLGAAGWYTALWYHPDGKAINGSSEVLNGVLQPAKQEQFYWDPFTNPTKVLTSPPYKQDVVLKLTKD